MVNVKHKLCIYEDCKIRPTYNVEGQTNALYCVKHKLDGMISICHRTCIYVKCKIRPFYNFEEISDGLYCASHKLDGMIDVENKRCIYEKINSCWKLNKMGIIQIQKIS